MVAFQIISLQSQNIKITNNEFRRSKIMKQKYYKAFSFAFGPLDNQAIKNQQQAGQQNVVLQNFQNYALPKSEYKYRNFQKEDNRSKLKMQIDKQPIWKLQKNQEIKLTSQLRNKYQSSTNNQQQSNFKLEKFSDRIKKATQISEKRQKQQKSIKIFNRALSKLQSSEKDILKFQSQIKLKKPKIQYKIQSQNDQRHISFQSLDKKAKINSICRALMPSDQQLQKDQGSNKKNVNRQCALSREASQQFQSRRQLQNQKRNTTYKVACYLIEKKSRDTPVMMEALNLIKRQYVNNNLYMMIRRGLNVFKEYASKHAEDKNLYTSLSDTSVLLEVIRIMCAVKCDAQENFIEFRRILLIFYLESENQKHPYKLTPDDLKNGIVLFRDIYKLAQRQKR